MQDELLIRFIDGTCTEGETEKVIEELSCDGNDAVEWLQMVVGARLVGSKPALPVPSSDARRYISEMMEQAAETKGERRRIIRWASTTAGLCAVAASIAMAFVIGNGNDGNHPASMNMKGLIAFSCDSVIYAKPESEADAIESKTEEDWLEEEAVMRITKSAKSTGALNPDERKADSHKGSKEYAEQETVSHSDVSVVYDSNASKADVSDSADSSHAKLGTTAFEQQLEMIRPPKSPYKVKVENLAKDFVFEWKCGGVANARLVMIDRWRTVLVDKTETNPEQNRIQIPLRSLIDKGELIWTLEITFPDGGRVSRTGRIIFKSDID